MRIREEDKEQINGSGIYMIKNLLDSKIYVGSSKDMKKRFRQHRSKLSLKKHSNQHMVSAYHRDGPDSFEFSIIELVKEKNLLVREQYWIDFYKSYERNIGYNMSLTAERNTMSEEGRRKISQVHKGKKLTPEHLAILKQCSQNQVLTPEHRSALMKSRIGSKHSEETKKRISEIQKGVKKAPRTPEHEEKLAASRRGRTLSDELKKRISDSVKGFKHTPEAITKIQAASRAYWDKKKHL